MADLQKTVEIVFGGKNELSTLAGQIDKDMDKLGYSVMKIATPLSDLSAKVLKLDGALFSLATVGLALATKKAGEFNDSFAEISTLITDTGEPIDAFKDSIINYSMDSVKSIKDINGAIYSAISAGVDYKDSVGFLTVAEQLSVAGRADLNATTVALISTLNAYGASTAEAEHYSDLMFTTVKLGQTTLEQLAPKLSDVTGIAAASGIGFDKLSAAIAALTAYGYPTEKAITAIKTAISNIIKPSGEAQEAAKTLGIEFDATALKTKGLEGVFKEVYVATGGNIAILGKLFGSVEALGAATTLGADRAGKYADALTKMADVFGATAEAHKKMADNFEFINQKIKNMFDALLITLGVKFLPEYAKIATSIGELFKDIKISIDAGAFDEVFKAFDEFADAIATVITKIAKEMPDALKNVDFSALVEAFKTVSNAITGAFGDTSSKELSKSIQVIVDSLKSLFDVTKGMTEVFTPMGKAALEAVKAFNSLNPSTKELIGNILGIAAAYKVLGPLSLLMLIFGSDPESAKKAFEFTAQAVENGINAIKVAVIALGLVFANASLAAAEFLDWLPGYDNTAGVARAQERVKVLSDALVAANKDLEASSGRLWNSMTGTTSAADTAKTKIGELGTAANKITGNKPLTVMPTLDPLTTEDTRWKIAQAFIQGDTNRVKILLAINDAEVADAKAKIAAATSDVVVNVRADGASIEKVENLIIEKFPNGMTRIVSAEMTVDEWNLRAVKKKIEDTIPSEKQMEIEAKIDETKIKEMSNIVQKSIEWEARIDIAQIETAGKVMIATFEAISNTVTSTGNTISSLIGSYVDAQGKGGTSLIENEIKAESQRRDDAIEMQKKMTDAQVDYLKQQTENLKQGKALIEIDGKGLQPHLEAFMFEILSAIQVKANIEGMKFLVGT